MNYYLAVLKKYAVFSGRAQRAEYWYFFLFTSIIGGTAMILDNVLGIAIKSVGYGPIYGLYALVTITPSIAVVTRRLHDVGKSAWMFFICLIPIIGAIWIFVLLVTDGDIGENKYGQNPKDARLI